MDATSPQCALVPDAEGGGGGALSMLLSGGVFPSGFRCGCCGKGRDADAGMVLRRGHGLLMVAARSPSHPVCHGGGRSGACLSA